MQQIFIVKEFRDMFYLINDTSDSFLNVCNINFHSLYAITPNRQMILV
jgi:hypothetical protein